MPPYPHCPKALSWQQGRTVAAGAGNPWGKGGLGARAAGGWQSGAEGSELEGKGEGVEQEPPPCSQSSLSSWGLVRLSDPSSGGHQRGSLALPNVCVGGDSGAGGGVLTLSWARFCGTLHHSPSPLCPAGQFLSRPHQARAELPRGRAPPDLHRPAAHQCHLPAGRPGRRGLRPGPAGAPAVRPRHGPLPVAASAAPPGLSRPQEPDPLPSTWRGMDMDTGRLR